MNREMTFMQSRTTVWFSEVKLVENERSVIESFSLVKL